MRLFLALSFDTGARQAFLSVQDELQQRAQKGQFTAYGRSLLRFGAVTSAAPRFDF